MTREQSAQGPGSRAEPGPVPRTVSYDVRVFDTIQAVKRVKGETYRVRWKVGGEPCSKTFKTSTLAKNHQAKLRTAANEGEPFDVETGLPLSMLPKGRPPEEAANQQGPTWYEFASEYVAMKWKGIAGGTRRGVAEGLATATLALVSWEGTHPEPEDVYQALSTWAFNLPARRNGLPDGLAKTIGWVESRSVSLASLGEPDVLRKVLQQLARRLDGESAAASTYARKRATLSNALSYAVEKKYFEFNPLLRVTWTAPKNTEAIDRRRVVNEAKGHALIVAVGRQGATGRHLRAFFGSLFLAGHRPAEATALTEDELALPTDPEEWGWLDLGDSSPQTGGTWTDAGGREVRSLKHRSVKETRPVPVCPPLGKPLRWHLAEFGTAPDGRLFRAENGGLLSESVYTRVWEAARIDALTPHEVKSVLAERPYDLRHARLSIWLNAGISDAQVAEWAGNSVPVLRRVYAKCLTDTTEQSLAKLGRARSKGAEAPGVLDFEEDAALVSLEEASWYELAVSYIDWKWGTVKPTTRRGITEALTKATIAVLPRSGPWPTDVQLGTALASYVFNRDRWSQAPDQHAAVIAWIEDHAPPTAALRDPEQLRIVLAHLGRRLDGQPASAAVAARRRSTLFNVFEFAVRERLLPSNPLLFRSWTDAETGSRMGHGQP
ncbi:tyrosine-type recombinase/integrase [Actinomadura atramentaria]|uniref:tyrosine-type recombinase/integrase n=1 Tax=Actinomadura atramentaria TaxID=1990 RepID=UPI0003AAEB55|nr:hypothetical protein [Actinomadura atramentaria]